MRHSPDPLQTAAADVADAVFPYDYRGVRAALARVPADSYARAARDLLDRRPGVALLITGFPVNGTAETDGPPGAAAVGRALRALSWHVVTVVDPMTRPVVEALGRDLGEIEEIDAQGVAAGRSRHRPVCWTGFAPHAAIAIERTWAYGGRPPGQHARRDPGPLARTYGRSAARTHQHWRR